VVDVINHRVVIIYLLANVITALVESWLCRRYFLKDSDHSLMSD